MASQSTVDIAAPVATVWAVLTDIRGWAGWMPSVKRSDPAPGTTAGGVGAEFELNQGVFGGTHRWRVTTSERPRLFEITSKGAGTTMVTRYLLTELDGGRTRVQSDFEMSGLLGSPTEALLGGSFGDQLDRESAALKERCEAGA